MALRFLELSRSGRLLPQLVRHEHSPAVRRGTIDHGLHDTPQRIHRGWQINPASQHLLPDRDRARESARKRNAMFGERPSLRPSLLVRAVGCTIPRRAIAPNEAEEIGQEPSIVSTINPHSSTRSSRPHCRVTRSIAVSACLITNHEFIPRSSDVGPTRPALRLFQRLSTRPAQPSAPCRSSSPRCPRGPLRLTRAAPHRVAVLEQLLHRRVELLRLPRERVLLPRREGPFQERGQSLTCHAGSTTRFAGTWKLSTACAASSCAAQCGPS